MVEWSAPPITKAAPDEDEKNPDPGGEQEGEGMTPGLCADDLGMWHLGVDKI